MRALPVDPDGPAAGAHASGPGAAMARGAGLGLDAESGVERARPAVVAAAVAAIAGSAALYQCVGQFCTAAGMAGPGRLHFAPAGGRCARCGQPPLALALARGQSVAGRCVGSAAVVGHRGPVALAGCAAVRGQPCIRRPWSLPLCTAIASGAAVGGGAGGAARADGQCRASRLRPATVRPAWRLAVISTGAGAVVAAALGAVAATLASAAGRRLVTGVAVGTAGK